MVVKIKSLSKNFGSKRILNDISIDIPEGEIFSLIGPNGAGKTTTMRCIFGDLRPDSGDIEVFGKKLKSSEKSKIAVMTEDRLNFKRFTGNDYVNLWKMLYPRWNEKVFSSFAMHYKFGLNDKVDTYSMGTKTLFHLALCIASGAELLILDEPTQNLDPVIRQEILDVLKKFASDEGKTIIISSHEIYELEEISSCFAIIKEGRILYNDSIDDAKEKHRVITRGEKIPQGTIIGNSGSETIVKTNEENGRYATFREIVLAYLKGSKSFEPFDENSL